LAAELIPSLSDFIGSSPPRLRRPRRPRPPVGVLRNLVSSECTLSPQIFHVSYPLAVSNARVALPDFYDVAIRIANVGSLSSVRSSVRSQKMRTRIKKSRKMHRSRKSRRASASRRLGPSAFFNYEAIIGRCLCQPTPHQFKPRFQFPRLTMVAEATGEDLGPLLLSFF